jgi:hypothetical protein
VKVYLDANIVIYLVENHPVWGPKALARITQLRASGDQIAVGDASRLECLVGPYILSDPLGACRRAGRGRRNPLPGA